MFYPHLSEIMWIHISWNQFRMYLWNFALWFFVTLFIGGKCYPWYLVHCNINLSLANRSLRAKIRKKSFITSACSNNIMLFTTMILRAQGLTKKRTKLCFMLHRNLMWSNYCNSIAWLLLISLQGIKNVRKLGHTTYFK